MTILSQQKYYRQRMIKFAQNHSVTETALRYKVSRKTVYKWLSRYDGTVKSLEDLSHRPKHSPRSHTEKELRQIRRRLKKHHWTDLLLAYQELVEKDGYLRSYGGFKRIASKLREAKPDKRKKKRNPKPYRRAEYPGRKNRIREKRDASRSHTSGQTTRGRKYRSM